MSHLSTSLEVQNLEFWPRLDDDVRQIIYPCITSRCVALSLCLDSMKIVDGLWSVTRCGLAR